MTPRDRRALRMGSLVVLGTVVLLRILPWAVRTSLSAVDTLRVRRTLLARTVADLQSLPVLEDSAETLTKALVAIAPRLLSGHGDGEAMAELQGRLSYLASTNHLKLDRVDPVLDSTTAGNLRRLTVDAVFEGDIRGAAGLLRALTGDITAMVPLRIRIVATDPASSARLPETLRLELRLTAWALRIKEDA
jgi:hypothetical protein